MNIENKPLMYAGTIVHVGERMTYGSNGFAKREVIVCEDPHAEYPKHLQAFLTTSQKQDRTELVTPADVGRVVELKCYVSSRAWKSAQTGKSGWFTEATCVGVDFKTQHEGATPPEEIISIANDIGEELPF